MIKISKDVAHKLNRDYGVPFKEGGISHTYSGKSRTYYLCESKKNMQSLHALMAK
jgi:hypothetical protein